MPARHFYSGLFGCFSATEAVDFARKIEAWTGSEWRLIAGGDARNALQYLIPQRTKRIRITIGGRAGRDVELKELHWYKTVGKKQADPQAGL